jgi:metal-responsive CopG/Arc/MetJ family transcriptional regulator
MVRTQIYLTEEERDGLDAVAKSTGKKHSELIREAIDRFLDLGKGERRAAILNETAGMWKNREDWTDFASVRHSWDRG